MGIYNGICVKVLVLYLLNVCIMLVFSILYVFVYYVYTYIIHIRINNSYLQFRITIHKLWNKFCFVFVNLTNLYHIVNSARLIYLQFQNKINVNTKFTGAKIEKFLKISQIPRDWLIYSFSGAKFCIQNHRNTDKHWDQQQFEVKIKLVVFVMIYA